MSVRARYGSSSGSSGTTATPPGGSASTSSALARATFTTVSTSSRCTGPMFVMSADVRLRERCEPGDLAEAAHAHLDDADLGVRLDPAQRQRHPELVVVVRLGGDRARCGEQSAARMSFVVVLPVEPVMPTTRALERSRTCPRDRASAACGCSRDERRGRPARERVRDEVLAAATATKRSPSSIRRESICTPVTSSAHGRDCRRPSGSRSGARRDQRDCHAPRELHVRPRDRRTESSGSRAPVPVQRRDREHDDVPRLRLGERTLDRRRGGRARARSCRARRRPRLRRSLPDLPSAGCRRSGSSGRRARKTTRPINGRFARSRSPPAPKTT